MQSAGGEGGVEEGRDEEGREGTLTHEERSKQQNNEDSGANVPPAQQVWYLRTIHSIINSLWKHVVFVPSFVHVFDAHTILYC